MESVDSNPESDTGVWANKQTVCMQVKMAE